MGLGRSSSDCVKPCICLVSGGGDARTNGQVLPGTGKPFEQFQADVEVCRGWAAQQVKGAFMDAPSWEVQRRYDNAYVQCMYAKGHQVPSPPGPPRAP